MGVFSQTSGSLLSDSRAENELNRERFVFSTRHMHCYLAQRVNPSSSDWSSGFAAQESRFRENWSITRRLRMIETFSKY